MESIADGTSAMEGPTAAGKSFLRTADQHKQIRLQGIIIEKPP
jgi:hypothetical protein